MGEVMSVAFSTSGSTGVSKTILKSAISLDADASMLVKSLPDLFDTKPYVVTTIRSEHMYGALWKVRVPLFAGCLVHEETILSVEELLFASQNKEKILLVTTPSFLEKAIQREEFKLLKNILVGIVTSGSLLKEELAFRIQNEVGIAVTEIFGSTETGSVAWRRRSNGEQWRVFDGVQAKANNEGVIEVDSEFSVTRPFKMGDAAKFTSPNTFLLLGRIDRKVKILERYVSLSEIEDSLEEHPLVAKAHAIASDEAVPRIRALVKLNALGKAKLKSSSYSAIITELKKLKTIKSYAFPRRIRFVNQFDYNEQGKLPHSTIAPILKSRYQEPVSENETLLDSSYTSNITFIPDAFYFEGHFNSFKILPGVVQLDYVERCIRRSWHMPIFSGEIARLKFQRPIQPRESLKLEISRKDEGKFSFSIKCSDEICTSGEFRYANF